MPMGHEMKARDAQRNRTRAKSRDPGELNVAGLITLIPIVLAAATIASSPWTMRGRLNV